MFLMSEQLTDTSLLQTKMKAAGNLESDKSPEILELVPRSGWQ